jgi:hypothetical protein
VRVFPPLQTHGQIIHRLFEFSKRGTIYRLFQTTLEDWIGSQLIGIFAGHPVEIGGQLPVDNFQPNRIISVGEASEGCWFVLFKKNRNYSGEPEMGSWLAFWAPLSIHSPFVLDEGHRTRHQLIFLRTSSDQKQESDYLETLIGLKRRWKEFSNPEMIDRRLTNDFQRSLEQCVNSLTRLTKRLPDKIVENLKTLAA